MYESMKRRQFAIVGAGSMGVMTKDGTILSEGSAVLAPAPKNAKPPKQLTDDDHKRIQAAAERRAKRNAKRVAVPAAKKEQEHE